MSETTQKTRTVLEVEQVTVGFRGRGRRPMHIAVDHVDLTVELGRTTGLVGESGAGKSTLARVVLGLVPVVSGSVRFLG
ncbi:MAG: ATP-binding cassette domain-containing protein, partial [Ilumatobacteraceae bacterium]